MLPVSVECRAFASRGSLHALPPCTPLYAIADDGKQAQVTEATLKGMQGSPPRDKVDVLEENLKRQLHETEGLRHDVLVQKLEFEKQTAALNNLIASIHAAQRQGSAVMLPADDAAGLSGGAGVPLSPIKRALSDGDDVRSPLNSLEEEGGSSGVAQGEEEEEEEVGGKCDESNDGDNSDNSEEECGVRQRQRQLSVVAEVEGEDETLGEQKVQRLHACSGVCELTSATGHIIAPSHARVGSRAAPVQNGGAAAEA